MVGPLVMIEQRQSSWMERGWSGCPTHLQVRRGTFLESGQLQRQWWCFWWSVSTCIWMDYQPILQFFNQRVFNFIHFKICNVGLIPDSPGYGLNLTKGTSFWLKHLEKKTFDQIDFWEERKLFSAITLVKTIRVRCGLSGVLKIHFYFSFILSSVRYFYASICSYSSILIGFKLTLCQS